MNIANKRRLLVENLRNLPENFKWDFAYHKTCAMGLAEHLNIIDAHPSSFDLLKMLQIKERDLFVDFAFYNVENDDKVTPHMVADALEVEYAKYPLDIQ